MKVFIIGFMGAGKSTFGKKLARAMNFTFTDLDAEIERQEGESVASIIRGRGEQKFREIEAACLKSTEDRQNSIISTGGGTPCFFDNMEWMDANGVTLYLEVPEGVLWQRLSRSASDRPLLENRSGDELKALVNKLLIARKPFYERACLRAKWEELSVDAVKRMIELNNC